MFCFLWMKLLILCSTQLQEMDFSEKFCANSSSYLGSFSSNFCQTNSSLIGLLKEFYTAENLTACLSKEMLAKKKDTFDTGWKNEQQSLHVAFYASTFSSYQWQKPSVIISQHCHQMALQKLTRTIVMTNGKQTSCFDLQRNHTESFGLVFTSIIVLLSEGGDIRHVLLVLSVMETLLLLDIINTRISFLKLNYVVFVPPLIYNNLIATEYTNLQVTNIQRDETSLLKENSMHLMQQWLDGTFNMTMFLTENGTFSTTRAHVDRALQTKHVRVVTKLYELSITLVHDNVPTNNNRCAIGIPCKNPLKNTTDNNTRWEWRCCYGLMLQIFDMIAKELDFTYDLYIVEDGQFGRFENGTWNGLIGELVRNKADVAVHHLIDTLTRSQYVDFAPAILDTRYVVVKRKRKFEVLETINWNFATRVDLWLFVALLVSTVIVFVFISMFENHVCTTVNTKYNLREALSYLGGLVSQRDVAGGNPRHWSGRFVALSFALATTIIINTYTAVITASNINSVQPLDFKGLMDEKIKNPTEEFKFGTVTSTAAEGIFLDNNSGHFDGVWAFIKQYSVASDEEGVESVFNGTLDGFITNEDDIQNVISKSRYCNSLYVHREKNEFPKSFAYRKGFTYGEEISKLIRKFRTGKTTESVVKKWRFTPPCGSNALDNDSFSWKYVSGLLVVMGAVVLFSILLILVENCYFYFKVRYKRRQVYMKSLEETNE